MRGQAAFEYMVIVGIVLAFMTPIWLYVTNVQMKTDDQLALSYAKTAVVKVASAVDLVFSQGYPAKVTVAVYVPQKIPDDLVEPDDGFILVYPPDLNMRDTIIKMRVLTNHGPNDVFAMTKARVKLSTANCATSTPRLPNSEGIYHLEVSALPHVPNDADVEIGGKELDCV